MLKVFSKWLDQYLGDEEALFLLLLLFFGFVLMLTMGVVLAPVITALIFAFVLQGIVEKLTRRNVSQWLAVAIVYSLFVSSLAAMFLLLLPMVWKQSGNFLNEMPGMIEKGRQGLYLLPEKYPQFFTAEQLQSLSDQLTSELSVIGQNLLSVSFSTFSSLMALMVYLVLVPILVFFFLKDRERLLAGLAAFLPRKRLILDKVLMEMDQQIANYIRGKFVEILIVGAAAIVCFQIIGLKYSVLLGVLVGLSVIVPYVGAVLVTLPVLAVGFFQWGASEHFYYLMVIYGVIQALDGNVLVPLLFSEAVNLHPVVIILAVLVFGGIWGFWGVFFAIPLATLFKAVIAAWPQTQTIET
ncbi:MAG: AI-2E family transporter [Pseudomonadales bacterium]|nr:AI-2E family transporter [Pseudomonadales bacterium]